jgi:cell division transport system ATP-binding protein
MTSSEKKQAQREKFVEENGIILLENVSMNYPEQGAPAIDNISLRINKGEFVFITGDSGSGKSTMIKMLLRELVPTSGYVYVNGYNTRKLRHGQIPKFRRSLGVVFQDFRLLRDRNVYENVAFAQRIIEVPSNQMRRNVPNILSMVGLAGKYKSDVRKLSGGEQQRVALARALINKPSILLADEPTGNLDPNNSWEIMKMIEEINEMGTTVVVVTHSPEIVNAMKKRVVTMRKGIIVSDEEEGLYINED